MFLMVRNFSAYLKIEPSSRVFCSSSLLMLLLLSAFLRLRPCETVSLPPGSLPYSLPLALPASSLCLADCVFLNGWSKLIRARWSFSFKLYGKNGEELIWPKFVSPRPVNLLWGPRKDRSLTQEVRETSQWRNYFHFINNKGKVKKGLILWSHLSNEERVEKHALQLCSLPPYTEWNTEKNLLLLLEDACFWGLIYKNEMRVIRNSDNFQVMALF